jgi:hypothetical protein
MAIKKKDAEDDRFRPKNGDKGGKGKKGGKAGKGGKGGRGRAAGRKK